MNPSSQPEARFLRRRQRAVAAFLLLLAGCGQGTWPDRDPTPVDNVRVDSLKFRPEGGRYVLVDSSWEILFLKFRPGYACSKVLRLAVEPAQILSSRLELKPVIRVQPPAKPTCAFDSEGRDSVIAYVFRSVDGDSAVLLDSKGGPTDRAKLVRGALHTDSLAYVRPGNGSMARGDYLYLDSAASRQRMLVSGNSLPACQVLNQAEYRNAGDTVKVRFTWVTLQPKDPDSCLATRPHLDTVPVRPARR